MDSENEISTELSESLIDFVNNHSIEELYANLKDLDKKTGVAKESKELYKNAIEETQQSINTMREQRITAHSQLGQLQANIAQLGEKLKATTAEKAAADQANFQLSKKNQEAILSLEQKAELNDKLSAQRNQSRELADRVETLEKQKADNQQLFADYHVALNERTNELDLLAEDVEEEQKRITHAQSKFEEVQLVIKTLCADVQRMRHKLDNPVEDEVDDGKSLFDQVIAGKKTLETELVNLIEITNVFRQQIRLKQDELEELETHEHENVMNSVDMEYVLSKMRYLVKDDDVVCMALGEIVNKFRDCVQQIEQSITDPDNKAVEFSGQYTNLRDYSLECLQVVKRECIRGMLLLKERFNEFEQLANEYTDLQERITHSK